MKFKKIKKNNEKGFTLVEMVMVVAILGILSSVGIAKYSKAQETAKLNADYVTATSIATAASIAISNGEASSSGNILLSDLVSKGYLTLEPKPQSQTGGVFLAVATGGDVVVKVGDKTFYPKSQINAK